MLKKISNWLFMLEKKRLNIDLQDVEFINYSELKSVLVLCSIKKDADFEQIKPLLSILAKDGKKASVLCCIKQKKSLLQNADNQIFIKREEISYLSKPNEKTIKWLKNNEFDAVFNLSLKTHIPLLYSLLYSHAKIKCGGKMPIEGLLDFIIDTSHSEVLTEKYLMEQIIFYLEKI